MWSCVWLASLLLLLGGSWSEAVPVVNEPLPVERLKMDAFQKIEAEAYNYTYSLLRGEGCSAEGVAGYIYNQDHPDNAYVGYFGLDFGTGAQLVSVRLWGYKDYSSTGQINFHLDDYDSPSFATVAIGPAGSVDCQFITVTSFLNFPVSGVRDVYLTFSSYEHSYVGGVDWFSFNQTIDQL